MITNKITILFNIKIYCTRQLALIDELKIVAKPKTIYF